MLRPRYVGAFALVLFLALSGCASAEKPDVAPPPKVSTSATPSPSTPPAPVMPEAAKADTKAGAVAFVKWYVELLNHAQATGDLKLLRAVAGPDCTSCNGVAQTIDQVFANGGSITGGEWVIRGVTASPSSDGIWIVTIAVRTSDQSVHQSTGDKVYRGARHTYSFDVRARESEVVRWSRIA